MKAPGKVVANEGRNITWFIVLLGSKQNSGLFSTEFRLSLKPFYYFFYLLKYYSNSGIVLCINLLYYSV